MSIPKVIKTLLHQATSVLPAINGATSDDEFMLLHNHVTNLLHNINFHPNKDSIYGLINSDATYRATNGHLFNRMFAALFYYVLTINDNKKTFCGPILSANGPPISNDNTSSEPPTAELTPSSSKFPRTPGATT